MTFIYLAADHCPDKKNGCIVRMHEVEVASGNMIDFVSRMNDAWLYKVFCGIEHVSKDTFFVSTAYEKTDLNVLDLMRMSRSIEVAYAAGQRSKE